MEKKLLSLAIIAALSTGLFGCAEDGSDGADGTNGTNGAQGVQGVQGSQGPQGESGLAYSMQFMGVSVPVVDSEKKQIRAATEVTINETTYSIGYNTLVRTNEVLPLLGGATGETAIFGLLTDKTGAAFKAADNSDWVCTNGSGPDHTSMLTFGSKLFAVTQLECSLGGAYVTELSQDGMGNLAAVATRPVDFSNVFGTYVNCAGMTTPWNSHLGSEEYEPPMANFNPTPTVAPYWFGNSASDGWHDEHMDSIARYNGLTNDAANAAHFGYFYGWVPEIQITSASGDSSVQKHYTLGRFAHELAYVMPDERTVYLSDDGTNVGLFMFVADTAQDLSAGTLYAAKWIQESATGAGSASLEWINLGHASNAEIKAYLDDSSVTFDTMFEVDAAADSGTGTCSDPKYTATNTYDAGFKCVMVKSGMEQMASRLETRLYAAVMGATTEFRKEEGITYNPDQNVLYVAMSEVAKGMENGSSQDKGGPNHIRLTKNSCGAVYGLDIQGGAYDSNGTAIDSDYVALNMYGLLIGQSMDYTGTSYAGNDCSVNGVSNPDNVSYLPKYGQLLIGEDTDKHQNDFVWSYDVKLGTMTRIATTPYGSETTSPFWHTDINGYGYATLVTQHPYGESDGDKAGSAADKESYVGYIGPFPSLK